MLDSEAVCSRMRGSFMWCASMLFDLIPLSERNKIAEFIFVILILEILSQTFD